jgi:hypothetical protein
MISLTLAPAELVALLVLLWTGPGTFAVRFSPAVMVGSRRIGELLR